MCASILGVTGMLSSPFYGVSTAVSLQGGQIIRDFSRLSDKGRDEGGLKNSWDGADGGDGVVGWVWRKHPSSPLDVHRRSFHGQALQPCGCLSLLSVSAALLPLT